MEASCIGELDAALEVRSAAFTSLQLEDQAFQVFTASLDDRIQVGISSESRIIVGEDVASLAVVDSLTLLASGWGRRRILGRYFISRLSCQVDELL